MNAIVRHQANGPIASAMERREVLTAVYRDFTSDPFARIKAIDVKSRR